MQDPPRREDTTQTDSDVPDWSTSASSSAQSSAPEEGRFPAGTVLAGRYRVLGMLGRGGMGEVYRAFDLILNQTVALKFLSLSQWSESALVRFRNEVRIARQVSHPNVCRVYDLGMIEGQHFLSMEYVDGEDLGSLLRRIGRLPQDKAIEIARKICAGLEAAHERGVLHRDLKPGNIMIDGRGHVRITDFGLAGLAEEIPLSDIRSGTPEYMSPEQKAGKEVTTRSDIYALGLVLHEIFTGRPYVRGSGSSPTDLVKDLDPAIERLILRCLEENPRQRPSSALRIAMALPGADPIAAALAAGETPSPEMVAASQEKEGFSSRTAFLCFAAIIVSLVAGIAVSERIGFTARALLELHPAALVDRAQQLLVRLGYTDAPVRTASGWSCCDQRVEADLDRYDNPARAQILASQQPSAMSFWYRQYRDSDAQPGGADAVPADTDSASAEPGMIFVRIDPKARLLRLQAQPWEMATAGGDTGPEADVDWNVLFEAAGLDPARFHSVPAEAVPPMMAERPVAWVGSYGPDRKETVRVEAASWGGRPVWFDVNPWADLEATSANGDLFVTISNAFVALLALVVTPFFAWRNWRSGRIDYRGAIVTTAAFGLAAFVGGVTTSWLYLLFVWAAYIAAEPQARRFWPDSVISWTRFIRGQVGNPLVASHMLAGLTAIMIFAGCLWRVYGLVLPDVPSHGATQTLLSGSIGTMPRFFYAIANGLENGVVFLATIIVMRSLVRSTRAADVVSILIFTIGPAIALGGSNSVIAATLAFLLVASFVWIWLMRRFGFLAFMTVWTFAYLMFLPLQISGWLGQRVMLFYAVPIAIAAWCLWVIVRDEHRQSTQTVV